MLREVFLSKTLLKIPKSCNVTTKRFKGKRGKHSSVHKKDPTKLALEKFDAFYQPVFIKKWPSIRLALLSPQKYSTLINNYAETKDAVTDLVCDGAENIVKLARETELSNNVRDAILSGPTEQRVNSRDRGMAPSEEETPVFSDTDLFSFMPTKKIASETEQLKQDEIAMNLEPVTRSSAIQVVPDTESALTLPDMLRLYTFEKGDIRRFPEPERDITSRYNYYVYDAASVLPVIALDLYRDCSVLDLCAAPGGKTLTMLQTLLPEKVMCIDNSVSRLRRLETIMKDYLPPEVCHTELDTFCTDGEIYAKGNPQTFDRVLVDAPCTTDRHVLEQLDNNLFKPSRIHDRVQLPKRQKNLLFNAIHACRPGGIIVYSTCTLSPVQNDGVIAATLEQIWQETSIDVAVVDTTHIAQRFTHSFVFSDTTRYGQLVVPNVTANFGPMYFCKLKRLN